MLYKLAECPFPSSNLYLPKGKKVLGGVVVLHGSDGGGARGHDIMAEFLAMHGYAALAFTWCASPAYPVEGVPADVINIRLEDTFESIDWLSNQSAMRGKKMALWGFSRGAEQALVLASLPQPIKIDAVAVHAATDCIVGGFTWSREADAQDLDARAWFWGGQPLCPGEPIAIENFAGQVFLSHGLEDGEHSDKWSPQRSQALESRLRAAGREMETLYLPGEKHILSVRGAYAHREMLLRFLQKALAVTR